MDDRREPVLAQIGLHLTRSCKTTIFDFGAHLVPQACRMLVERRAAEPSEAAT